MHHKLPTSEPLALIERAAIPQLFDVLTRDTYRIVGPTIRENVIVYDDLNSVDDLPIGYRDSQEGGTYRLKKTKEPLLFGYVLGPDSWKKYLSPPHIRLWRATREDGNLSFLPDHDGELDMSDAHQTLALIGVRACELNAIAIQDKVFLRGPYADPIYKAQRENLFIVAVNCTAPGGTCFCTSMQTGPRVGAGYDLALT